MNTVPDALLCISPGCPYCQNALSSLSELIKKAEIGRLEVINLAAHPEVAQDLGIRSVPWMRIGPFELTGQYSLQALREWAQKAQNAETDPSYIQELLREQAFDKALDFLEKHPRLLDKLLDLSQKEDTDFSTRLGISALLEALENSELLQAALPRLEQLAHSENPAHRADAAHYLGLTHNPKARPILQTLAQDEQADVREIAIESLEKIASHE